MIFTEQILKSEFLFSLVYVIKAKDLDTSALAKHLENQILQSGFTPLFENT